MIACSTSAAVKIQVKALFISMVTTRGTSATISTKFVG
jgi:hypothetical protein